MTIQLTKTAIAVLLLATFSTPPLAKSHDQLPDTGTSANGTMSIGQELANDPLLTQYIKPTG